MTKILLIILFCSFSLPAMASTSSVGGSTVTKGAHQIDARTSWSGDDKNAGNDDRIRTRMVYDYGLTDKIAIGGQIDFDKRHHDSFEYDDISFQIRRQMSSQADHGLDTGIRLRYTHRDGANTPHNADIRFTAAKDFGDIQLRFNQLFEHDLGENAIGGVVLDTRLQVTYKMDNGHRIGVESFSEISNLRTTDGWSDQDHSIGPVLKGSLPFGKGLSYETGYRHGLSDSAADNMIKFFVSKSF
jgi:hypothetical protein